MNINIPDNLAPQAQELVRRLLDTRRQEVEALSGLTDEQLFGSPMKEVEPAIWEMGHVGWFQEYWILRNLDQMPSVSTFADNLYDSTIIRNNVRWDLTYPSRQKIHDYITEVLQLSIQRMAGRELSEKEVYFYRLVIDHEDWHFETMMYIRHTLGYAYPPISVVRQMAPEIDEHFELHDVEIPGGTFMLGATPDHPSFVLDCEKWAHPVEVAPFRISNTPVTTAHYQAFVEAGGYQAREYWSDEGWEWRQKAEAEHPVYWEREADGSWTRRAFDQIVELKPYHPMMHVNFHEANAYCAWAGRRLPTEAEWEMAASAEPTADGRGITTTKRLYPWGNDFPTENHVNMNARAGGPIDVRALPASDSAFGCRQMIGNIWEWTADNLNPYPGFEIDPYEEYSEPSFGDKEKRVLRGGSWVTPSRVIRNTWRNFYDAHRNNLFVGFRTCAL